MKYFYLFLILISVSAVLSQPSDNVKSLSLGRTSVSNTYNLDAFNHNPANLREIGSKDSSHIYFNILSSAGYVLNSDFLNINFYNRYFTADVNGEKRFLTNADKTTIFNSSKNTNLGFNLNYKIISALFTLKNFGTIGIALEDKLSAKSYISEDLASLTLFGNDVGRTYNVSDFNLNSSWIRQINITYANSGTGLLGKEFTYGISVKPQMGYYYLGVKKNDLTLSTDSTNTLRGHGSLDFITSNITDDGKLVYPGLGNFSGAGLGFDAGVNVKLNNRFNIGLSIVDVGYIKWFKNVKKYVYNGSFTISDLATRDQLDSLRDLISGTKTTDAAFSNSLPTTIRIGMTYKFLKKLSSSDTESELARVSVDYIQGLNKNVAGNTTTPILAFGGEFAITHFLYPRIGMIVGGEEKYTLSAGLGLNTKYVLIDVGTHNILTLFNVKNSSRISGGINIKFRF